jgi:hypothetical protein
MMGDAEKSPELAGQLTANQGGADALTFELLPEVGAGLTAMTEGAFRKIHSPHGDLELGRFPVAEHRALVSVCKLACPCGALLIEGDKKA